MSPSESWRWRQVSGSLVFRSKLRPPNTERLIRRSRLLELLDANADNSLTLVIAPAGTGKTALLATWVVDTRRPIAWLSLDSTESDATQFWTAVVAALEHLVGDGLPKVMAMLHQPNSLNVAVAGLLDALESYDCPASTLLIDDVHLIVHSAEVLETLAVFVLHLPRWLHVVMAGRRAPRLPLARMRAAGELGEVRIDDLKFSDQEAAVLLIALAPSLDEESIARMVARADGWAAGIQLAAIASRSTERRLESPDEREGVLVSEYLWQEVLGSEPPELVETLLDISLVERVNTGLAQRMTGRADAGRLLCAAEARGLFLSRLGATDWFELHSLIRARLRAELIARSPARLPLLHARAARWFEEVGEVANALDQWFLAERPRSALRLLAAKTTALYDTGSVATLERALARVPADVATLDGDAAIEFAWCFMLLDRMRFLQEVERVTEACPPERCLDPTTRGRLRMLRSIAATVRADWSEGGRLARRAIGDFSGEWWQDFLGRFSWNMIGRDLALSERWHESADAGVARRELSRDAERTLALQGARAMGEALAGQPLDALRVTSGVREAASTGGLSILRLELEIAEALAHRELGNRSQARKELEALAAAPPAGPVAYIGLLARLELARLHLDEGRRTQARSTFHRAADWFESEFQGAGGRDWVGRVGTLVALADGDLEKAARWSATVADPFWGPVGQARTHLSTKNRPRALECLDAAVPRCVRHEVVQHLIRSRALHDHEEALKSAGAAAELAAAYGLVQTVASEGTECLRLIELVAWRVPEAWLDHVRRAPSGVCTDLVRGLLDVETLTTREQEVLRLLPGRLNLNEIADELYISMNTLKFHLKVIYRKLGCSSRAEAADLARGAI
jgi:LuxR family maltose regulon positive regulatory protein